MSAVANHPTRDGLTRLLAAINALPPATARPRLGMDDVDPDVTAAFEHLTTEEMQA